MIPSLGLIVVAAGSSRRMTGIDKTWATLAGQPVVAHSVRALAPLVRQVVLVVRSDHLARAQRELAPLVPEIRIVVGGAERQDSVARGLESLEKVTVVAVHDAARPLVTPALLTAGLPLLVDCQGAVPTIPIADTIKWVTSDGAIGHTLDRSQIRAVQTPQLFRLAPLREAHQMAVERGLKSTDDATLVEELGYRVGTFPGAEDNFKITTDFDLTVARLLIETRR